MQLAELETPALIADRSRIEGNARRMREHLAPHGVSLRPHLKTTKSAAIARIAHDGRDGPSTVSTLREAEYFFEHGFRDLTYAVCITPNKFAHVSSLNNRGLDLKVLLASPEIATALADFAGGRPLPIRVMIEIDSGVHRTGLAPNDDALIDTGRILAGCDGIKLLGLLTHGGHSYGCRSREAIEAVAEEERSALLSAKDRLEDAGIAVGVLSSGSTPTALLGQNFDGLSELRPGVYLGGDLFQAQLGTCGIDDIAISVLASVIAHDRPNNRLVLDAGGLALSKDRSTEHAPKDYGYGLLVGEDGSRFETDMIVAGVSQEHGEVRADDPLPFDAMPVGSRVRVLPNHVCMTAASYDRYFVTESTGTEVIDEWHKATGW